MPFNGTGVASPPNPPTFPAVSGQVIEAAKFNAIINDLYACLTQCLAKDGQTVITGVLQWADKDSNLDALGAVSLTATQAVDGVKTFSSPPKSALAASGPTELIRKGEMDAAVAAALPAGVITSFAGSVAPSGWLMCTGQVVSRTTYAALFAAIGTTYGAGDGTTTFKLPDLRGEFIRGWDAGRGVDAGRTFGSAQGDAIRNITGWFTGVDDVQTDGAFYKGAIISTDASAPGGSLSPLVGFDASRAVPTAGENRPRNVALLYIIKT
jgi:hypothetical protein